MNDVAIKFRVMSLDLKLSKHELSKHELTIMNNAEFCPLSPANGLSRSLHFPAGEEGYGEGESHMRHGNRNRRH